MRQLTKLLHNSQLIKIIIKKKTLRKLHYKNMNKKKIKSQK